MQFRGEKRSTRLIMTSKGLSIIGGVQNGDTRKNSMKKLWRNLVCWFALWVAYKPMPIWLSYIV